MSSIHGACYNYLSSLGGSVPVNDTPRSSQVVSQSNDIRDYAVLQQMQLTKLQMELVREQINTEILKNQYYSKLLSQLI